MNRQRSIVTWCVAFVALMVMTSVSPARGRKAPVLTPQGEKIAADYTKMLEDLKQEIVSLVPGADENVEAEFTKQLEALRNVPSITKNVRDRRTKTTREVTLKCDPGNPAFVEKQKEVLLAARAVLKDVDVFLADDKRYTKMAKFAFLSHADPKHLAGFAQQGEAERALIDDLVNDDELVAQVMILGGAGDYGQAMRSYRAIQKASKRSHEGFFQTWALAVSLRYCGKNYIYPGPTEESLVKYYLNYLKAYDDGILDPAFSNLGGTGWNYRFVFPDSYGLEDIEWIRKVMRNYRPDHLRLPYRWRYCRIVRSDIPYRSRIMPARPDLNLSRIQDFFLEGGVCGPRAFTGQISCYAFGIPTLRAPSPGHGAMAHWTPEGWTTVLGPHFYFCSHINGMKPMEFLLLSQAQEDPEGFKQALMCEWLGKALGEAAPSNYGSSGGFWPLLGLYRKQAIVEDEKIKDIGATGEELAESDVSTEKEEIEQIEVPEKFRKITVAEDGTITIPVGACKSPKSGEKIRFMESVDGGMQAHYRLKGPRPELFSYSIYLPKAGKYELTAHVCTVTVDRQALLRVNRRTLLDFDIPYTKADWMDTEPVELDLKEGRNRIGYTHYSPNTGVSIKHFTLKPVKRVGGTSGLSARSGGAGQNEIANMIGVRMARIAPGSFMMGSTTGPGTERPAHRVTLSKGFYMGVTEVTQGQWESVMPENPSRFKGSDRPVENVVLKDCVEFCKRLTQKERAQGKLPEGAEYRLPTEAEWEYACRAGSEARYGFGNSETDLGEYAWYRENSVRTQPVGMKKANAWGLFDMHGNVWEWCSDWNGSYSADDAVDPTGAPAGASYGHRVFRGGSWGSTAAHCRSATRNGCGTNNSRLSGLGFRLVRTLPGQSSCVIAYQLKDTVMNSAHKLPQENQQVLRFSTEDGGEGTRVVETVWQADRFNSLFKILCKRVLGDSQKIRPDGRPYEREGRIIDPNPTWLRDHIHEMKAYQYLKKDITSFVDEIITLQHADGFYYEILGNAGYWHQWCVDKKHFLREDDKDLCWIRLEMEADIEYLMVEAAHRIWQATGDFEAMKRRLPSLERGLEYNFTDPTRWNAEHGALMRTFSIDTWDFTYGVQNDNRKIRPHFPMGIMHGDNSGLYRACLQLSEMLTAAGNTERAAFWRKRGEALRERINKLCFNGNYYTHQILLQPVDTGVKEEDILSLSNTYDINRGLPTHAMAVKIIDEYQRRRAAKRETHFAEWFSVDPPYPKFGRFKAGEYINGGICGLVAGELSKAAFHHGREAYAADILDRVDKLVARDGFLSFLYDNSGKNQEGGPRGWPAAAVISAMVEGLAGIRDEATLFQTVTVAPRFTAAGMNQAYVCLKYGPSDAWVAMDYRREGNSIALQLGGNPDLYHVKILLPKGVKNAKAADAATAAVFTGIETIEESHYATLDIPAAKKKGEGVACKIEWIEGRRD